MCAKNPESVAAREIVSRRLVRAPRDHLWRVFENPADLAQWWGPKGFTTTMHEFDFRPGGVWRFTMHAPTGEHYPNEKIFEEIVPHQRIVFRHLETQHAFEMTLSFAPATEGTEVTWRMLFDAAEDCAKVREFIVQANEENFDRLESHVATLPKTNSTHPRL